MKLAQSVRLRRYARTARFMERLECVLQYQLMAKKNKMGAD